MGLHYLHERRELNSEGIISQCSCVRVKWAVFIGGLSACVQEHLDTEEIVPNNEKSPRKKVLLWSVLPVKRYFAYFFLHCVLEIMQYLHMCMTECVHA